MHDNHDFPVPDHAIARRGGARRTLTIFLALSMAAHAAMFGMLPAFTDGADAVPASVLQVTLLEPVLVPGPAEPVSQPRSRNEERARAAMPRPSQRETPPATIPALPELPADERRPFIVGAELPEPAATAPMEPAPAAAAPVAPARLNAGYLQNPAPRYPVAARRAGEQGAVTLRVLVSRDGSAARVDLEKSSGSAHLDAAARDAVKAWRFAPARRGGEPVESWMLVPVVFRLEGAS